MHDALRLQMLPVTLVINCMNSTKASKPSHLKKQNSGWGMWHKNKYEEEYQKSVYESQQAFEEKSVFDRCLEMESTDERLVRLKHKFGDNTSQHHLQSIYMSKTYENNAPRKDDPAFNFIKNVVSI